MPPAQRKPATPKSDGARSESTEAEVEKALVTTDDSVSVQDFPNQPAGPDGSLIGPGLNEDIDDPNTDPPLPPQTPPPGPIPEVRLARPAAGPTPDQNLWTLIRNRTNAISFNNYNRYINEVLRPNAEATDSLSRTIRRQVKDLAFLGLDGFEVLRAATQFFLMHEVGLIVEDYYTEPLTAEYLQKRYDYVTGTAGYESERRRRNGVPLSASWLADMRNDYLQRLGATAEPKVLPYLKLIMDRLSDLPLKEPGEVGAATNPVQDENFSYGVLPSRLVGPLGLELIWSYWMEEGMLVQAHNAVTNRFQNQRTVRTGHDPLARMEIDPLRRLNNVLWGWIQNRPFLLSVRRRAFEYDHHYGVTLLGTAVGDVDGVDSRSQFISAFHNLLHQCTIFYQQDDDLTMQADGFPLLNALRETQLVVTAGAHNQYGDLPWTARVEMLMQMWMFARPEMREFLGGRVMVPYKEPWMDRVDAVKSMMGWTDVNVTHFRDLGTFGEQIVLSIRYGSWATEIEPESAVNWARYWRPEIQGYVHAYRAATGADLRSTVDTSMPGRLLEQRLAERNSAVQQRTAPTVGRSTRVPEVAPRTVHEHT
ncbi:hypothetical protein JOF56_005251 [Kibdelosporangium banguiense]|uniref:Uncharacterized protein n=1 Tax=Kibdelosporangium banguiense TaxID=1365924 RepID=A0ABS4TLV1_9PSEU|nr:hypothetical protein [Kibdelosporangium banguiense]MBP2324866.1 hypothetical protein [Kibdelosporangium banguiense]